MQLQKGYGTADVTNRRPQHQQLFSTPDAFPLQTDFPIPASSSSAFLDLESEQRFLHQQYHNQQQQQLQQQQRYQPSELIDEPFAISKFRLGIDHQNGSVLPHHLIGLAGGDGVDHKDPAAFWRSDNDGMADQQFQKYQRTAVPNYRHQAPEFEIHNRSAGEIYETHGFPNPNPNSNNVTIFKCSKCSSDSNADEDYEKKLEMQLKSMAQSFESRLLAHQERLYERFMEKIDKLEKERSEREESWRAVEAEKARVQAAARAQEQAAASSREAVLVSYLEKITGEKIHLPASAAVVGGGGGGGRGRWPRAEVEALIKVRSEMEVKFREPGLKASLWEEISTEMEKLGYQRNAKRCKEKWENINKYYFRKSKDEEDEGGEGQEEEEEEGGVSVKKRGTKRRFKTCSYFDQLKQLYSPPNPAATAATVERPLQMLEMENNANSKGNVNVDSSNSSSYMNNADHQGKDYCEGDGEDNQVLLDAMMDLKSEETAGC